MNRLSQISHQPVGWSIAPTATAYKSEIVEPAEEAIRDWLVEVSRDENPYTEDKITS